MSTDIEKMIRVFITRQENASFFGASIGDVVEVSFEEYVKGVVASEVGNPPLEAAKAQAVAARSYAWYHYAKGEAITDSSSKAQAYRASRAVDAAYALAHQGTEETQGLVLIYGGKVISPSAYSASNGGKTTSSQERWGGSRPYLIAQEDPWDYAATKGVKQGHGVGMSQEGAKYAARKLGKGFEEILGFYYPGCVLVGNYNETTAVKPVDQGGENMVRAGDLIEGFQQMLREKWKYVYGRAEYGKVDCSGAFTYWYRFYGSDMYHGSNTMYRKWTAQRGERETLELVPGMALFKHKKDGSEPAQYQGDGLGSFYHVGLYVGDGQVIEARSTQAGVVSSRVEDWPYAARLINTQYDSTEDPISPGSQGIVHTSNPGGYLNLRGQPSTSAQRLDKIPDKTTLEILRTVTENPGWLFVQYKTKSGYVDGAFVEIIN